MIGVASRKANRAASSFDSPARRPPPIVAPDREKPGISASACADPTPDRFLPADALDDPLVRVALLLDRRAPPQQLGAVEEEAICDQEQRCGLCAT